MDTVIVILGPTASGKTALSVELAREINGEIVSADSMQVYKYMNIGTAKPDKEERKGIKHFMIGEIEPDEEFNVARYKKKAYSYIKEIHKKSKVPIVAGGTGLYINSLIYNINFTKTICDWDYRKRMRKVAEEKGNLYLHNRLKEIDPEAADEIHHNNIKRVIRALEVYKYTKKPLTYHKKKSMNEPPKFKFIKFGLNMQRELLYENINKRVDQMLRKGLVEEVSELIKKGFKKDSIAMQGLGYKEVISYLKGECTLDETVNLIKRNTRRYAKRQMTWFKKIKNVIWINVDEYKNLQEILEFIKTKLQESGFFCKM